MAVPTPETPNLPAPPKLATAVLLLRDTHYGLEVYVQGRVSSMRFTADMTMLPGDGVDRRDFPAVASEGLIVTGPPEADPGPRITQAFNIDPAQAHTLTCAVVRETFGKTDTLLVRDVGGEIVADGHRFHHQRRQLEAHESLLTDFLSNENLALDAEFVSPWANWVTPKSNPIRYDTYFFLTVLPDGQRADGDTSEASSSGWFRPTTTLDGRRRGLLGLMPPAWAQLTRLDGVSAVTGVLKVAKDAPVRRTSSDFFGEPFMDECSAVATHVGYLCKGVNRQSAARTTNRLAPI